MKYCCTSCRYTYDEGLGDTIEGIDPGTKFYGMQDFFVCPVCGDGIDSFELEKEDVLYAENDINSDHLERQHIPDIQILGDKVFIKIGLEQHPMEQEHYITSISIYDEYGDLVEEEFLYFGTKPEIDFDISNLDSFEIRAKCSLHGIWGKKIER